jgi:hypothetical protein
LAIPNRPFSDKAVKIIAGKNPPDGDYRKPLTESELELLQRVVPGLSIRVVDSMPELFDPLLEFFLREYYHMGDSRIKALTWDQIFDACKQYLNTQQKAREGEGRTVDDEINSETREQVWREEAPEYITNSYAVKMAEKRVSIQALSKLLRKPGNTIRWMRNEKKRRSKVHAQDFKDHIEKIRFPDRFSDSALEEQQKRKAEIDAQKRKTGE